LPRQPGQKENRYAHLLAGEPALEAVPEASPAPPTRIVQLEADVQELRSEVAELKRRFEEFEAMLK
jgi:uncharacterized protein YceH (UPF0502 family)